jgi:hypothetical protein
MAAERGSSKLLKETLLPKAEVDKLWKLIDSHEQLKLLHWWIKGQPAIDALYGIVRVPIKASGEVVPMLLEFQRLRLRLDLFPYGTPWPDELLIAFEPAAQIRR